MKAFNVWLKKEGGVPYTCEDTECQESLIKSGWKAALEWALETRPMDRFGISKVNCIQVSNIKKELEQ